MSLIFVLDSLSAGNAYIRGILPVNSMVANNIDAKYVVASEFKPSRVSSEDTVVFVKYDRLFQSKAVKYQGASVVLDIVDSKKHWKQHRDFIDALIVNTESQRKILINFDNFTKPIFKIPHILTNHYEDLKGQLRKQLPKSPKTIGYLGVKDTFSEMDEFESFSNANGYEWYHSQPNIYNNEIETLKLDLGCIHFTEDKQRVGGTLTNTKPSAKLINMFSYGIPVLFTPYESYLDAISLAGFEDLYWCCCSSKHAMYDKISILSKDSEFYKHLSNLSYELSRNYHIYKGTQIYKDLIDYARK